MASSTEDRSVNRVNNLDHSQFDLSWTPIPSQNFLSTLSPGTYLLRNNEFTDPKHYVTLIGLQHGSSKQLELFVTYEEDFTGEKQDDDDLQRMLVVQLLKAKCIKYNEALVVAAPTDNVLGLQNIERLILAGYDCFAQSGDAAKVGTETNWSFIPAENFLSTLLPGMYLLRNRKCSDLKYCVTLTGLVHGSSRKLKFFVTEEEGFSSQLQDYDYLERKLVVQVLKAKCIKYNNALDIMVPTTLANMVIPEYNENILWNMLEELEVMILLGYDSFAQKRGTDTTIELVDNLMDSLLRSRVVSVVSLSPSPPMSLLPIQSCPVLEQEDESPPLLTAEIELEPDSENEVEMVFENGVEMVFENEVEIVFENKSEKTQERLPKKVKVLEKPCSVVLRPLEDELPLEKMEALMMKHYSKNKKGGTTALSKFWNSIQKKKYMKNNRK